MTVVYTACPYVNDEGTLHAVEMTKSKTFTQCSSGGSTKIDL